MPTTTGLWHSHRNCSISPRGLLVVYAGLATVSLSIAAGFWLHGAPLVLPIAGVEIAAVGLALFVWARHAGDREDVSWRDGGVEVDCTIGDRVEHARLMPGRLRVGVVADPSRPLVELDDGEGRAVRVGRFVRAERLPMLAADLRARVLAAREAAAAA